jgi:hypothetical protein
MQFNAVVDTNEHAVRLCESLGFNDSKGVHPKPVRRRLTSRRRVATCTRARRGREGRALDRRESTRLSAHSAPLSCPPQQAEG